MRSIRFALGSMLVLALFVVASQAQVQRTFVSGLGSDGNPCSRTAPCRTFGQAIMGTSAGGEVIVLDSAGYGAFAITKSVSIIAPQGVYAGISVFSGDGIDINAGANDTVILRGLTVNSQGGDNGIVFNSGRSLNVEICVVNGFVTTGAGIRILSPGNIVIKDTIARRNIYGVFVQPSSGTAFVAMDGLHLADNSNAGLFLDANLAGTAVEAAIRNSSISGNANGVFAQPFGSGVFAFLDIESCLVTNNNTGLLVMGATGASGALSISNCTISHNPGPGFFVGVGGAILSRGNNTILGNGANFGSLTPLAAQ